MSLYASLKKRYGGDDDFFILRHFAERKGVKEEKHRSTFDRALAEKLAEGKYSLNEGRLFGILDDISETAPIFDEDLCRLIESLARCLLIRLTEKEVSGETRNQIVSSLFYLRECDFEAVYTRYSLVHRLLSEQEIYRKSDEATRMVYRMLLAKRQKRYGSITKEDAERVISAPYPASDKRFAFWYFPAVGFVFGVLTFVFAVLTDLNYVYLFFALLPMWEGARRLISDLFSRMIRVFPLPKYEISDSDNAPKTMTVITALLDEDCDKLFEELESISLTNREPWAVFGLLADLKDSETAWSEKDDKAVRKAEERIAALNETYGDRFCLFIRKRVYSKGEGCYMAEERKRGAVETLTAFLRGEKVDFVSRICPEAFQQDTVYVITLDSDTHLKIGMVKQLVGAMEHPANSGFGFLQPRMDVSLTSLASSRFVRLYCGTGGNDLYAFATYELYASCFGRGSFCGKGIFRVDDYRQTIAGVFPKESVLSHDLMEGERAGTLYGGELSFTDSFPKDILSYFKRQHRWVRGDVMALLLAKRSYFPLFISRYKMAENVAEALLPIMGMLLFLLSLFQPTAALPLAFSYLLLPVILAFPNGFRLRNRRLFSSLPIPFFTVLFRFCFDLASLPFAFYTNADAILRALWRSLVSHKKRLEWTTASEAERGDKGLLRYLSTMWVSLLAGGLFVLVGNAMAKLIGILWLTFPFAAYCLSQKDAACEEKRDEGTIRQYAADLWRFFEDTVSEADSFLPPDNIQLAPHDETAHRTSPTNIGLYLLSCAAAHRFGFLDEETLLARLNRTMDTLERCPRWKGHLYNWYDTRNLTVLGHSYVSTVDSGNFAVCLLTLAKYLSTLVSPSARTLSERCRRFSEEADFSALYDERRKLLRIGRDTESRISGENVYDILMSEARTTVYYAVSRGQIPPQSYARLSRQSTSRDGYVGLLSWSGSAFEYFMPTLFLPTPPLSLHAEALAFAFYEQKKDKTKGLFGRSEGAYYAFDAEMNYQYKPNGVRSLAIQRARRDEKVYQPYASFLMLEQGGEAIFDNLKRMRRKGLYGKYGFYEAIDFTPTRTSKDGAVLYSYMSHHIGMSLLACANYTFDGLFRNLFMRDRQMAAHRELLEEKADRSIPPSQELISFQKPKKVEKKGRPIPKSDKDKDNLLPRSYLISNGKMRFFATTRGDMALFNGKIALTRPSFSLTDHPQMQLLLSDGKSVRSLSEGELSYRDGRVTFHSGGESFSVTVEKGKSLCEFTLDSNDKTEKAFLLLFEPTMTPEADYNAHPAYSKLPLEAMYDEKESILFFKRRPKYASDRERWLAVSCLGNVFSFETRKDDILTVGYNETDFEALFSMPFENRVGACIEPYCALKSRFRNHASVCLAFGHTRSEAAALINARRRQERKATLFASLLTPKTVGVRETTEDRLRERYLTMALYGDDIATFRKTENKPAPFSDLWKNGISGDLPIVSASIVSGGEEAFSFARTLLRVHHRLTLDGFRSDLVLLYGESDLYSSPERHKLLALCGEEKQEPFLQKKGGVFLLPLTEKENVLSFSDWHLPLDGGFSDRKLAVFGGDGAVFSVPLKAEEAKKNEKNEIGNLSPRAYTIRKGKSRYPQSFLYCSPTFGTLLTQHSLGFTYFANAREKRLTFHTGQRLELNSGERLLLKGDHDATWHDLALEAKEVVWQEKRGIYRGESGGILYTAEVGVARRDLVKLTLLTLENKSGQRQSLSFCYDLHPLMGEKKRDARYVWKKEEDDTLFFGSNTVFTEMAGFLHGGKREFTLEKGQSRRFLILLGVFPKGNRTAYRYYLDKYASPEKAYEEWNEEDGQPLVLDSGDVEFDAMVNHFLPLQTVRARLWARSGFYQSSGAYGFRDQLQDAMGLLPLDSSFCRRQILRCAARQYTEGDVMHWWHEPRRGLRTRISDDRLFLPYAVAEYLRYTGDLGVLDIGVPYLTSPPLSKGEEDRFEQPTFTKEKGSLYEHCLRAIDVSLTKGSHGLPLIGSGDWNDGFNRLGLKGRGESVWLAMFLLLVLRTFLPYVREKEKKAQYENECRALEKAILNSREKGWFLRAYDDEGKKIGSQENDACRIDLLTQAYYAILFGKDEKSVSALGSAMRYLYDGENRLLRLLSPPFDEKATVGYIASYPSGVRENGGQYTHGAVWGAWGLLAAGENEKGAKVLKDLCVPCRLRDKRLKEAYRLEEYCLAGDVYTNYQHYGRGGWSHYTGAAGQFLKVVYEQLLGYREEGNAFSIHPRLSDGFSSFTLEIRKKGTHYTVKVSEGVSESILLDGKKSKNRFPFDKKRHFVEIVVEKNPRL